MVTIMIAGLYRGLAFQADEPGYPPDQVELLSEVHVREALGLSNGDPITVLVRDSDGGERRWRSVDRRVLLHIAGTTQHRQLERLLARLIRPISLAVASATSGFSRSSARRKIVVGAALRGRRSSSGAGVAAESTARVRTDYLAASSWPR